MRQVKLSLALCASLLFAHCGDDGSGPPSSDSSTVPDTSATDGPRAERASPPDQATSGEAALQPDGKGVSPDGKASLSCGQVGLCSETCGKKCPSDLTKFTCLLQCNSDCKALSCASAKPLFDALTACIQKSCLLACISGPSTGCTQCTVTKCANETIACNAHKC